MKRNLKNILSAALAFILVLTLSLTAFAAELTKEDAISIAFKDALYSVEDALYVKAQPDYDDGVKCYEIEFAVVLGDNLVGEYEYEVRASDGAILSKDNDTEVRIVSSTPGVSQTTQVQQTAEVTLEKAKEIAAGEFGFNASDIQFLKAKVEYDDGREVYEIEFRNGFEAKYSCEIDVLTGSVTDKDVEVIRDLEDKIELIFEIIIAWFVSR